MRRSIFVFLLFFVPSISFGQVVFTEIMYDFPGTEGGGEHDWIEVLNDGNSAVDISTFKFFENDTNHGLKLDRGTAILAPGAFAVIASATSTFLADWPNFSGTLFDSSFSLNSTSAGESLVIRTGDLVDEDSVTYSSDWGAKDDGNSLQKDSSGNWIAALPTPGAGTAGNSAEPPADSGDGAPPPETPVVQTNNSNWSVEPQIFAVAGKDRVVIAGAAATFEGRAYGLKKEPIENARFVWNFGDGMTGEGKTVLHTYRHPGDYLVVLDTSSGFFSGSDRLKVRAEASPLFVSAITDGAEYFIEITNTSKADIDISSWWLALADKKFEIPKNTFVLAGKKLIFSNEATGFTVGAGSIPELLYPNGTLAHRYGEAKKSALAGAAGNGGEFKSPPTNIQKAVSYGNEETPSDKDKITEDNTAAAANSLPNSGFNYSWLLGVAGISAVSIAGIFLARRYEQPEDEAEKLAREIEIVE